MRRFSSGGHPFLVSLESEKKFYLHSCSPLKFGDTLLQNPICSLTLENSSKFRSRIPSDLQQRFRWLTKDTFMVLKSEYPFYLPEEDIQYMKPYWQKVGQGILELRSGISRNDWLYRDPYGIVKAKFIEPCGSIIYGDISPSDEILHCQVVIRILCSDKGFEDLEQTVLEIWDRIPKKRKSINPIDMLKGKPFKLLSFLEKAEYKKSYISDLGKME